jgi:glyoxylase I family protein
MIEPTHLCPLIQVFDMPASLRFYRDLLGFEVVQTSSPGDDFDWGWLRLGGANLMLNTAYERDDRPAAPDPARVAAHEDTILYFGADPDAVYAHLRGRGIALEPPKVAPYGMKQVGLRDPDGYGLCFQQPV